MLNSKQRAKLRALANTAETIVHIGKSGITDEVIRQADEALTARELIKLRVLDTAPIDAREACAGISEALNAESVQVIGTRFVLFRINPERRQVFFE